MPTRLPRLSEREKGRKSCCSGSSRFPFFTPLLGNVTSAAPLLLFPTPGFIPLPGERCGGTAFPAARHPHLRNRGGGATCRAGGSKRLGEGRWQAGSTAGEDGASEVSLSPRATRWRCGVQGGRGLESQRLLPAALRLQRRAGHEATLTLPSSTALTSWTLCLVRAR